MLEKLNGFLEFTIYTNGNYKLTILELLLFLFFIFLTRFVASLFERFFKRRAVGQNELSAGSKLAFMQIIKYGIYIFGFIIALQSLGINLSLLIAGSAALFVGIGFGLQQSFRDLIAGLVLLFEGSMKIGDVVRSEDLVGIVKKIGLGTSAIETKDKVSIIVPNSLITDRQFVNYSYEDPFSRFNVTVGVAYGTDVEKVRQILLEVAEENQEIMKRPIPKVLFKDFGESSLDFELFFTTRNLLFIETLKSDLRFAIYKKFGENKIQIPFPQRDLHLKTSVHLDS